MDEPYLDEVNQVVAQRGEHEPERFIHAVVSASPAFAAQVMAYDPARVEADAALPITLRKDGVFLQALLERNGQPWLTERLGEAATLYGDHVRAREAPPDFLVDY